MATAVCARDAHHGLGLKGRVGQVVVEANGNALDRLQVTGIQHIARHLHGVDLFTR